MGVTSAPCTAPNVLLAGSNRRAVQMHRARTALSRASVELGARPARSFPRYPRQGHFPRRVHAHRFAVDDEIDAHAKPPGSAKPCRLHHQPEEFAFHLRHDIYDDSTKRSIKALGDVLSRLSAADINFRMMFMIVPACT
jgi:hypothetical protein